MLQILLEASYETIKMVLNASILTILFGIPLGLLLEATHNPHIYGDQYLWLHKILYGLVDYIKNIPIFLTLVVLIPIINNLFYEIFSIQTSTAIVIGIIGIFIFSKKIFKILSKLPSELSDTAKLLGANKLQTITKFLLPQAMPQIIKSFTQITQQLISLSITASILGIEGLGKVALEKGFQEADFPYLFYVIILATIMIYLIKLSGNLIVDYITNKYHYYPNNN